MKLNDWIAKITPVDETARKACEDRLNLIGKPLGSLGALETMLMKVAAITGNSSIDVEKKCVLVFCGDNGVVANGVAQSDHTITTAIGRSMVHHTTSVCTMAKTCGADVFPIDMGMTDTVPGMIERKLMPGTNDFTKGPAMTEEVAEQAILTGIREVEKRVQEGYRVIATGEAGIGNTTTSSALAAVLLNLPVETVTGRGSGLTNEGLVRKCNAIRTGIAVNHPDPRDPVDVLAKVGGLDIAGMVGAFLGGAIFRVPVIVDGLISMASALTACRICPETANYLLASHMTAEPAGVAICKELGLEPMIHAGMRLGEGTGAVTLMPILDMAAAVYHHAATFDDLAMQAYEKLC